jgi:hypothetical protein
MTTGTAALTRSEARHIREAGGPGLGTGAIHAFAIALALSGMTELLLQRVVYRVGVHIPRDGAYLETYRAATFAGDFAFRLTAVLLTVTTALLVVHMIRGRGTAVTGLIVGALLVANLLVWPLATPLNPGIVALGVAAAAGWIAGTATGARAGLVVLSGAVAVVLSQFWAGMSLLGHEPAGLASMHLVSEVAIICAALLAAAMAFGRKSALRPALGACHLCA